MSERRQRVFRAAAGLALLEASIWTQGLTWLQAHAAGAGTSDFRVYYVAARIGLGQGWSRIYDTGVQLAALHLYFPNTAPSCLPFLNPALAAWLAIPLAVLPPGVAYALYATAVWLSLLAASQLSAPAGRWARLLYAGLALASLPAAATVVFGQSAGLVLLALALSAWLLRQRREVLAGLALAAALGLKPQLAVLAPVALLVAGRYRAVAAAAGGALVMGAAMLVVVGPAGTESWLRQLQELHPASTTLFSLTTLTGSAAAGWALRGVCAGLVLAVAWLRREESDVALAAGVTGSLLAAVYLHGQDLSVYLLPVWICARRGLPAAALAAAAWLALEFTGATPLLATLAGAALLAACAIPIQAWPRPARARPAPAGSG